ncbi:major facilitator superfamily MFS_1 [Firmicutes bacterium CAG:475]|nr:major facilitator superfamily MFS_1 [Firmicutes bacterium CAG:475]
MRKKEKPAPVLDEKGRPPLKLDYPQTFKVGFAFAIIMLFWTAYDFVVPLLLEHAYGLPSWARGIIMGLDNLLSLFMLPLFGKLSDNAHGKLVKKWGRRTPFIVIGTVCAVVLMVFVPVATLKQQAKAQELTTQIESQLNDDSFMQPLLEEWYDNAVAGKEGSANYCDLTYLGNNKITREQFVALRYDSKMTSKKAVLNMLGATTYYYDGEVVEDLSATSPTGKTYQEIVDSNAAYKKYVAAGMNNYISNEVNEKCTKAADGSGIKSLVVYMVILLLVLIAMATFRSPAVALMPDVTPKPLRSQANAIINLCGGIGGAIAFLIYTVVLFGQRLENYVIIFGSVAAGMLLLLAGFLALVNERKMVAKCQEICKEYEIDDFADGENPEAEKFAEELIHEGDAEYNLDSKPDGEVQELVNGTAKEEIAPETLDFAKQVVENTKKKPVSPKEWWGAKNDLEKGRLKSFALILASIFMWFMGYNAVSSNLSIYTTKSLNLSAGVASIISGVSMGISAIAFIPVGYMAAKIGRRKSIMIGFAMAVVSFVLICFAVRPSDNAAIPAVLFALFYLIAGFGLIIANVNTFPMVTELSTAETVGQYTGYYYVATMSAQAITPAIGGAIMDAGGNQYLFLYSAVCIVIAIVLMLFVKHGDSKQLTKGRKLTKEEKKQIRLDALDAD